MANYLLIESRDPFDSADTENFWQLALALKKNGDHVTLFLVQNAVLATRPSPTARGLTLLTQEGVKVLADDFSLKERGVRRLAQGIERAPIDVVVDHLEAGDKALWH